MKEHKPGKAAVQDPVPVTRKEQQCNDRSRRGGIPAAVKQMEYAGKRDVAHIEGPEPQDTAQIKALEIKRACTLPLNLEETRYQVGAKKKEEAETESCCIVNCVDARSQQREMCPALGMGIVNRMMKKHSEEKKEADGVQLRAVKAAGFTLCGNSTCYFCFVGSNVAALWVDGRLSGQKHAPSEVYAVHLNRKAGM